MPWNIWGTLHIFIFSGLLAAFSVFEREDVTRHTEVNYLQLVDRELCYNQKSLKLRIGTSLHRPLYNAIQPQPP
jgi:hypothetical protein